MMDKDIHLALDQGKHLGVPMFTAALSGEMLTAARAQGHTEADFSSLYHVLAGMTSPD
jgi:3-hydroxyisobutyrate dehydrogenase-like beta-hydroxyacid dehydrogenase